MNFVLPDQLAANANHDEAQAFYAATLARWLKYMEGTVAVTGSVAERRAQVRGLLEELERRGLARQGDLDWSSLASACVTGAGVDASALASALAGLWVHAAE